MKLARVDASAVQTSTLLVSLVLNAGVSVEELAEVSGIDLQHLRTSSVIPYDEGMRIWHAEAASLETRLEAAIRIALARLDISLEAVAAVMRTSSRSLQRQLQAEQLQFAVVRDRVLLERAKELLSDPSRRVDDVAQTLCSADRTAFLRAYRRWTGTTPRASSG